MEKYVQNDDVENLDYYIHFENISDDIEFINAVDICLSNKSINCLNFILDCFIEIEYVSYSTIVNWFYQCENLDCLKSIVEKDLTYDNVLQHYFNSKHYCSEILEDLDNEMKDYIISVYSEFN